MRTDIRLRVAVEAEGLSQPKDDWTTATYTLTQEVFAPVGTVVAIGNVTHEVAEVRWDPVSREVTLIVSDELFSTEREFADYVSGLQEAGWHIE